jgi:hypothetical protein
MKTALLDSNFLINNGGNVLHLTQWLSQNVSLVGAASDEEKNLLVRLIASNLPRPVPNTDRTAIGNALRSLPIFKKVSWNGEGGNM